MGDTIAFPRVRDEFAKPDPGGQTGRRSRAFAGWQRVRGNKPAQPLAWPPSSVSSSAEVRSEKITVVALGKIGLPLTVQFASKGHDLVGLDVKPDVVDLVNRGAEPIPGEAGLAGLLDDVVHRRLHATTEYGKALLLVAVGKETQPAGSAP